MFTQHKKYNEDDLDQKDVPVYVIWLMYVEVNILLHMTCHCDKCSGTKWCI